METPTVRRVDFTSAEIDRLASLPFGDGLVEAWNLILHRCGEPSLSERTDSVRPGNYAIPSDQWKALVQRWCDAAPADARTGIAMTWVNVGPSGQD